MMGVTVTIYPAASVVSYDELSDRDQAARIAPDLIRLLFTSSEWVNRGVDSLSFPDDLTVSRSIGIDFTIPQNSPIVRMGDSSNAVLLPIARVRKAPMAQFHFKDEAGRTLPLLPRHKVRENFVQYARRLAQCDVRNQYARANGKAQV